jgi:hypothetical protein
MHSRGFHLSIAAVCLCWLATCSQKSPITVEGNDSIITAIATIHAEPGVDTIFPSRVHPDGGAELVSMINACDHPRIVLWWNETVNRLSRQEVFDSLAGDDRAGSDHDAEWYDSLWRIVESKIPCRRQTVSFTEIETRFPLRLRSDVFTLPPPHVLTAVPGHPDSKYGEARVLLVDDVDNDGVFGFDPTDSLERWAYVKVRELYREDTVGLSDALRLYRTYELGEEIPDTLRRIKRLVDSLHTFHRDSIQEVVGTAYCRPHGTADYLLAFSGYHTILFVTDTIAASHLMKQPHFYTVDTLTPGYNFITVSAFLHSELYYPEGGAECGRDPERWTNLGSEAVVPILRARRWGRQFDFFNSGFYPAYVTERSVR